MSAKLPSGKNQQGFTIIELMIATAVFSVILVMMTVMMIGIGKLYFKGINQARVQNNVRSVTDELAQKLKLLDSPPAPIAGVPTTMAYYCLGTTRYTFRLNTKIGTGANKHILWRDTVADGACAISLPNLNADPASADPAGTELIAPNSRLTYFDVSPTSPYIISVGVAYGDDDLLPTVPAGLDTRCNGAAGQEYCAVASLTTTVVQRK